MWWMRQNFVAQLVQLLMCLVCKVWSGVVTEKIGGHPADQCGLQVSQFSVHLINLLSTLLRCSGFTGIQKAVVDQTGSRPWICFWCRFGFGKCFAASSLFSHWSRCHLLYKIHFSSHFAIRSRNGLLLCRIREDTAK